jgi:hypothetical protein
VVWQISLALSFGSFTADCLWEREWWVTFITTKTMVSSQNIPLWAWAHGCLVCLPSWSSGHVCHLARSVQAEKWVGSSRWLLWQRLKAFDFALWEACPLIEQAVRELWIPRLVYRQPP